MLMVDGVELAMFDHPHQMRELQRDHALGFQRRCDCTGEIVDVRDMGIDVVAKDQIGGFSFCCKSFNQSHAEEILDDLDPLGPCRIGGGSRGFHPEAGHARRFHVLQKVAIVGGQLDHETVRAKIQTLHDHVSVAFRMGHPARGSGGEIGVIRPEDIRRAGVILRLHKAAGCTDVEAQGIGHLGRLKARRVQIGVGQGRMAEIEEPFGQVGIAMAAGVDHIAIGSNSDR